MKVIRLKEPTRLDGLLNIAVARKTFTMEQMELLVSHELPLKYGKNEK